MNLLKSIPNWLVWKYVQKEVGKKPSKVPFTVNGQPREMDSPLASYDEALRVSSRYDGIGFALTSTCGIVALDFDNCVDALGNIDPRVEALCSGTYTEYSPSGTGVRALFSGSLISHKDTKCERGPFALEVFGNTGFVTITGNATPATLMWGLEDVVAPVTPAVMDEYTRRGWSTAVALGSGDDLMALSPTLGWTLAEARRYLFDCPATCGREDWLKALMAVHHELGGSEDAFKLVDEWSATGDNYGGTSDVQGRWRSFGRNTSAGVTGKWLLKWRSECLLHKKYDAVKELKALVADAQDEFTLREKICHTIAQDERLDDLSRETLAQALCDKFRAIGSKYPIAQCRKLIEPVKVTKRQADGGMPEWCANWVYVTDRDNFYRMDSDEWLSMQSFNAKFNRLMETGEDGFRKSASWSALEDFGVPSVTRAMYIPWAGPLFDLNGVQCVNSYRPSSVPKASEGALSAEGLVVIESLVKHLRTLCGSRKEVVEVLLDWVAHNVQKPGVKIRWAPLIKGVPGDGKTLIGTLLGAVCGQPNVKNISPNVLATDFTDWAHGACIGVMEEIKLTGHNRYDIINKLKPYITNNDVTVHPKGHAEYNAPNTTNYIAFTNFADAIPMDNDDRRWMIIHSPFGSKQELEAALGGGEGAGRYFDRLYDGIAACRGDLRRWFLDRPIALSFKPNGTAPITEERSLVIALSESPEEEAIKEVLEKGAEGVGADVLSSSCLVTAAMQEDSDLRLNTTIINRLLTRMGWFKVEHKARFAGRTHRLWVRNKALLKVTNDELRIILEKTLPENPVPSDLF
jgi:Primase C terminal 2 (PriCT-2)/Family of unknown function (DUF5906)